MKGTLSPFSKPVKETAVRTHHCRVSVTLRHQSCGPAHRTLPIPAACTPENPLRTRTNNTLLCFCEDACHFVTCHTGQLNIPRGLWPPWPAAKGRGQPSALCCDCRRLPLPELTPGRCLAPAGKEIAIYRVPMCEFCTEPLHSLARGWANLLRKAQSKF